MKTRDPLFILYVRDMERALTFYRDTFELEIVQQSPGWSLLRFGGAILALHLLDRYSPDGASPHAGLNFHVDDLDAAVDEVVRAGGKRLSLREPTRIAPVRQAEMLDTEGNRIELRQFVGADRDWTASGNSSFISSAWPGLGKLHH